jgi:small basic protein
VPLLVLAALRSVLEDFLRQQLHGTYQEVIFVAGISVLLIADERDVKVVDELKLRVGV